MKNSEEVWHDMRLRLIDYCFWHTIWTPPRSKNEVDAAIYLQYLGQKLDPSVSTDIIVGKEAFAVSVKPGFDATFAMGVVVVVDQIDTEDYDRRCRRQLCNAFWDIFVTSVAVCTNSSVYGLFQLYNWNEWWGDLVAVYNMEISPSSHGRRPQ
jgi:hypothetical protein